MNAMSGPLTGTRLRQMVGGKTAATRAARGRLKKGQLDHLHETGAETTRLLLTHEPLIGPIGDPCCGRLAIARVLAEAGFTVVASDIVDYRVKPEDVPAGVTLLPPCDVLALTVAPARVIVINPPYDNQGAEKIVAHLLGLLARVPRREGMMRKICVLHRARFLESELRDRLLDHPALSRVLFCSRRQPMMHRPGHKGRKQKTSPEFYAWFIFDLDAPSAPGRFEGVRV